VTSSIAIRAAAHVRPLLPHGKGTMKRPAERFGSICRVAGVSVEFQARAGARRMGALREPDAVERAGKTGDRSLGRVS